MFRLLKLLFLIGMLGGVVWFGMTVKLGDRTLFEHLRAIVQSKESQNLMRGTKAKVGDFMGRATDGVVNDVAKRVPEKALQRGDNVNPNTGEATEPPQEKLSPGDRKALRHLIGQGRAGKPE